MKHITYILIILLIVSCAGESKKSIKKPDNLITKDKMVDIIYDMSLVSAAKGINRKLVEQEGVHPEKYIYEKYGIDSLQFAKSNEYYTFNLDTYEEIYKRVKAKLEKDKKHYTDLAQIEDKERDSINKERKKNRDSISESQNLIKNSLPIKFDEVKTKPKAIGQTRNTDSLRKLRNRQN
ncbi:MAG: DUF4296 domain-containing protein [Flavobacteriaceae bacterium]